MVLEGNDAEMREDVINTASMFNAGDILEAAKCSNFNKGLGLDGFDGNMLKSFGDLNEKITAEITEALNSMRIPEYPKTPKPQMYD